MFRKLKVIGFFLFFLLGIFLFNLNLSQAETLYLNQSDYSAELVQPYFVNSAYDDFFQVFETQGIFAGDSINSIETYFRLHSTSTYGQTNVRVRECPTPWSGTNGVSCTSPIGGYVVFDKLLYATNQLPIAYRNEWVKYLATSTTFIGTTTGYTMIQIDSDSPTTYLTDVRGTNNGSLISSSYLKFKDFLNNYSTSTSVSNVADLYLKIGLDINVPINNTGQYVDFVFPTNGTTTPDFKFWKTTYGLNATTTNPSLLQIRVQYGTTSTNLNLSETTHLLDYNYHYKNFPKLNVTDIGTYYAKLYLQTATSSQNSYIIASSSLITFFINEFNGGYDADDFIGPYPLPDLEECGLFDIFSSTDWSLFFTCLSQDLFWPSDDSLNTLKENINSFSGFFPFNIFFDFSNTVQSALSTTSSNTLYLDWEVGGYTATGTILSPTLFYDTLGTSTTDLIFNLQRNGLWLFTGFKILSFLL